MFRLGDDKAPLALGVRVPNWLRLDTQAAAVAAERCDAAERLFAAFIPPAPGRVQA